jgi:flagellar basal-body rod protein FlgB
MIEGLFTQPNYVAAKKLLDVSELRHQAIASNLAHLETPNYKRIDVAPNFAAQLSEAVESRNARRIDRLEPRLAVDSTAVGSRKDGNTVQLESELMRLNRNYLEHHLETQLVSGSMLRLRLAITGKSA